MEDTIAAISTPVGEGGIAIIRMSGPEATSIADELFFSRRGKPSTFPTHTIHYGTLRANGNIVDQVLLSVMRAPQTYTREDMVEISCHGGVLTARTTLGLCLQHGARLAEPGEFTQRAFLNGRLDLTQAEAVMDLIRAQTDRAHSAAAHVLEGWLSQKFHSVREQLIAVLAHLEAHIDFPEEGISPDGRAQLQFTLERELSEVNALLATVDTGRILREGILVAIVGCPNVGKSSLMNALLGQDRSIVTNNPGTTRDTIEELVNIGGIPVRLTDTAGMRNPRGKAEAAGVNRSHKAMEASALILCVLDSARPMRSADLQLYERCAGKQTILVLNKSDLRRRITLTPAMARDRWVRVSALTGDGIDKLRSQVESSVWDGKGGAARIDVAINQRHATALLNAKETLTQAIKELKSRAALEITAQLVRTSLHSVGEITGQTATEDVLNKIFSTFCIGK